MNTEKSEQENGYSKRIEYYEKNIKQYVLDRFVPKIKDTLRQNSFNELQKVESSFLTGRVGSGKSVMAAWMTTEWTRLQYMQRKQRDFRFLTAIEMLQILKNSYNNKSDENGEKESEIIHNFKNVPLLVIDDFGIEKTTDWAFQLFYSIICYRYDYYKTTIYTSNLSLDQLALNFQDDRITSRIAEQCKGNIIEFK